MIVGGSILDKSHVITSSYNYFIIQSFHHHEDASLTLWTLFLFSRSVSRRNGLEVLGTKRFRAKRGFREWEKWIRFRTCRAWVGRSGPARPLNPPSASAEREEVSLSVGSLIIRPQFCAFDHRRYSRPDRKEKLRFTILAFRRCRLVSGDEWPRWTEWTRWTRKLGAR